MDLGGINLGEIWTTVGGVLGTPAAIFLFWMYSKMNDLANKVKFLEQENRDSKQTLSDIRFRRIVHQGQDGGRETMMDILVVLFGLGLLCSLLFGD